jgi:zinc protease
MKFLLSLLSVLLSANLLTAQPNPLLRTETYQLDNGLTVMLNPDSTASRVYGAVMVNAGAKHELPEATGMAHYLEHLLFKGTRTMGTLDYAAEKPHLDSINRLYERLAVTEDPARQAQLQAQINEQAKAASQYGLPNEFDRLLRGIGGTGINAFTNHEMTFYHNSFPAHEVERWLDLYATRFDQPVFRSFQSELEVVYEEKNRAMDDMGRKFFERLRALLYPNLPYGQWSVLGKVEHLKKPSLIQMYDFFERHYVPGNMALILTGNFDPAAVKPLIEARFGAWEAKPVPRTERSPLQAIEGRQVEKVRITPIKVGTLSWQTVPIGHPDRVAMDLCEYLLFNQDESGLLNQLKQQGDLMFVFGTNDRYLDAGGFHLILVPKPIIQPLRGVRRKVLEVIEQVKQGQISEEAFLAARNALAVDFQAQLENLERRGRLMGRAFNQGVSWEEYLRYPERLQAVSLEEVAAVAQRYLGEDRVELISRTGFAKPTKLAKPPFEPVTTDQKGQSAYAQHLDTLPSQPFAPRYLDFETDVQRRQLPGGHELWHKSNPLNDRFTLSLSWQKGTLHDPRLSLVADLLSFTGTEALPLDALKQRFASLGCSYGVSAGENTFTVRLSGREAQLEPALILLGQWLDKPVAEPEKTMDLVYSELRTERKLEEESPSTMGRALINYAIHGEHSPYLTRPDLKEVKQTAASELLANFTALTDQVAAQLTFVGQTPVEVLEPWLRTHLPLAQAGQAVPFQLREQRIPAKPRILVVDNKKAVQSQVYFYVPGVPMDPADYPQVQAFNDYFGGGFSGIVLQEIREYRSLAYSARSSYNLPALVGEPGRLIGYLGCQADKTLDAIGVMHGLIQDLPLKADRLPSLRRSLQMEVVTQFPDFRAVPGRIRAYERQGFRSDPNRAAYAAYSELEMDDLAAFHQKAIADRPYLITIYGDTRRIDLEALAAYGEVEILKAPDIRR